MPAATMVIATTMIVAIIVEMAGLRLVCWSFIWIFMLYKSASWALAANLDYASFALDYKLKHRDGFLYIGMAIYQFYFPDDEQTLSMWRALEDERRATGKSMSKIVSEALEEHVEARRAWAEFHARHGGNMEYGST
jgi:hypothetical protein